MEKRCIQCANVYRGKRQSKYCSGRCAAISRIPGLIERNKSRRKYPPIPGLSRQSVFWMYNPNARSKDLARDTNKRENLVRHLGGKCVKCGYDKNIKALELDHKENDGDLDRKKYGAKIYRHYIKHLELASLKLQVLCANCNKIKAIEENEHAKNNRTKFIYKSN